MNVLFPSEIDVSILEYSDMRPFGDHAKVIYVSHKQEPVIIQTPLMKCPYGLGRFDDGEKTKYSLDLSLGGDNKSVNSLKTLLESIDDKVLNDSTTNSLAWFKKKNQSRDVSQALFSSSVKVATENGEPTDKYPPTFKIKVPSYKDEFNKVLCYDDSKQSIESDLRNLIPKGQNVRCIVRLAGVWFAGGKFGLTWDLLQVKLTPRAQIKEYAFQDESEDEDEDNVENEDNGDSSPVGEQNYVLDSEDEL